MLFHTEADRRRALESLIMHRLVCRALRRRRELVDIAVFEFDRREALVGHTGSHDEWRRILRTSSVEAICGFLTSRSEEAYRLRIDSPFTTMSRHDAGLDFTDEAFRRRMVAISRRLARLHPRDTMA